MSYVSLYRKHRPGTFEEVLGQPHVTETLTAALEHGRVAHAYLFSGPRGSGKTSTARILAKALNCKQGPTPKPCGVCDACIAVSEGTSLDVYEMDAASHTSVDDVREIRDRVPLATVSGGTKVYIIDEAHMLSTPAFNALLKMLEEPPGHVVFVLATTEAQKLPATVASRCQRFEFRRLTSDVLAEHMKNVAAKEGIEADDDGLALIARHSGGSARDALSLLDQTAGSAGKVTKASALELLGEAPEDSLFELSSAVCNNDVAKTLATIQKLTDHGWDPRSLLRQLLDHFRDLLVTALGAGDLVDAVEEKTQRYTDAASSMGREHLEWVLKVLGEAQADVRAATHPRLALEIALIRASALESEDASALRARIERLERALLTGAHEISEATTTPAAAPSIPSAEQKEAFAAEPESISEVAPSSAQAAPSSSPVAITPPGEPISELDAGWTKLLEDMRTESRVTFTHLSKGRPVKLEDGVLTVAFAPAFHGEQLTSRPEQLQRVVTAISKVFGPGLSFASVAGAAEQKAAAAVSPSETSNQNELSPEELLRKSLGALPIE